MALFILVHSGLNGHDIALAARFLQESELSFLPFGSYLIIRTYLPQWLGCKMLREEGKVARERLAPSGILRERGRGQVDSARLCR